MIRRRRVDRALSAAGLVRAVAALAACVLACAPSSWGMARPPAPNTATARADYLAGRYPRAEAAYLALQRRAATKERATADLVALWMEQDRPRKIDALLQTRTVDDALAGEAWLTAGRPSRAADCLQRALTDDENDWRLRMLLGVALAAKGDTALAADHYWQALQDKPREAVLHYLLGSALETLAAESATLTAYFRSRAREEYGRTRRLDGSWWQTHWHIARLAEEAGDWEDAWDAWGRMARILRRSSQLEAARARWRAVWTPTQTPQPTVVGATPTASPTPTEIPTPPPAPAIRDIRYEPLGGARTIRVGLGPELRTFAFACAGSWTARTPGGVRFWRGLGRKVYRIMEDTRGRWVLATWEGRTLKRMPERLILAPAEPGRAFAWLNLYRHGGYLWSRGRRATRYYRGRIDVRVRGKTLRVINRVPMEDYLASVLPAEMPALWPEEALKAQAVVARSDTWARLGTHGKDGYDVCGLPHCAAYGGVLREHPRALAVLRETAGRVLLRGDRIVPTFYSHACGGVTQDPADAWWKHPDRDEPGAGVRDWRADDTAAAGMVFDPAGLRRFVSEPAPAFCADARYSSRSCFRWVKVLDPDILGAQLERHGPVGRVRTVAVEERGRTGYARIARVKGDRGELRLTRDYLRTRLGGLRSNLFVLTPVRRAPGEAPWFWLAWGGGWGHGVGFCQSGAAGMAAKGYGYRAILEHYFPGTELGTR